MVRLKSDQNGGTVVNLEGIKPLWARILIVVTCVIVGGSPVGGYFGGKIIVANGITNKIKTFERQLEKIDATFDGCKEALSSHEKALLLISDQNRMIGNKLGIEGFPDIRIVLSTETE